MASNKKQSEKPEDKKENTEQQSPVEKKAKGVAVKFQQSYRSYFPGDTAVFPKDMADELCKGDEKNPAIATKA